MTLNIVSTTPNIHFLASPHERTSPALQNPVLGTVRGKSDNATLLDARQSLPRVKATHYLQAISSTLLCNLKGFTLEEIPQFYRVSKNLAHIELI